VQAPVAMILGGLSPLGAGRLTCRADVPEKALEGAA